MIDFASKNEFQFRELGDRFREPRPIARVSGATALASASVPFEAAAAVGDPALTDETSSRFSHRAEREFNDTLFRALGSPTYEL